jgi:hypothetical protein
MSNQASTRQSPFYLMHGWHPKVPLNTVETSWLRLQPCSIVCWWGCCRRNRKALGQYPKICCFLLFPRASVRCWDLILG